MAGLIDKGDCNFCNIIMFNGYLYHLVTRSKRLGMKNCKFFGILMVYLYLECNCQNKRTKSSKWAWGMEGFFLCVNIFFLQIFFYLLFSVCYFLFIFGGGIRKGKFIETLHCPFMKKYLLVIVLPVHN